MNQYTNANENLDSIGKAKASEEELNKAQKVLNDGLEHQHEFKPSDFIHILSAAGETMAAAKYAVTVINHAVHRVREKAKEDNLLGGVLPPPVLCDLVGDILTDAVKESEKSTLDVRKFVKGLVTFAISACEHKHTDEPKTAESK